jgi:hypothetical protein
MNKKRTAAVFLYGLIFVSLMVTLRLADTVSEMGTFPAAAENVSVFGAAMEELAKKLPVWAYIVIFAALAVGIRGGMIRYYKKMYFDARERNAAREQYIPINRYKTIDPDFSNDRFAEMVGQKQELIRSCAKSGNFLPVEQYFSEAQFSVLPGMAKLLSMEMLQIKLEGFRQIKERDIAAVLMTCISPGGFQRYESEWLFERPCGASESGEDALNYGGWTLFSIKSMG